jgi:cobalt-zinc-cadmium efflux system protein
MTMDEKSIRPDYTKAFAFAVGLNLLFAVIQVLAGIFANSLSLLADAAHNLGDVLGLGLTWGADTLSKQKPTERRTYGYRGGTILSALVNAVILFIAVGGVAWESIRRLGNPGPVDGTIVMWVAGIGILVNSATAIPFFKGGKKDINLRAAFLHLASDAAVSAGVVLTGYLVARTGRWWLDPCAGLLISGVIVWGAWGVLRDSLNLALAAVPAGVDIGSVRKYLAGLPGVGQVHDLHIWGMSTTETALTVHLVMKGSSGGDQFLKGAIEHLQEKFGIEHATVQLERGGLNSCCKLHSKKSKAGTLRPK